MRLNNGVVRYKIDTRSSQPLKDGSKLPMSIRRESSDKIQLNCVFAPRFLFDLVHTLSVSAISYG